MESGHRHHSHQHHRPNSSSKRKAKRFSWRVMERFFLHYGFGIAGVILVSAGIIFLIFNYIGVEKISGLIPSRVISGYSPDSTAISSDVASAAPLVKDFPSVPAMVFLFSALILAVVSIRFRWRLPFLVTIIIVACYITYYILWQIIIAKDPSLFVFMLSVLLIWLVTFLTGLGCLKPGPERKAPSTFWSGLSYIGLGMVIGLSALMVRTTRMNFVYPLYTVLAIAGLVAVALFNERFNYLRSRKPIFYSICILSALVPPQLIETEFVFVLPASLSVGLLVNVLLTRSRVSYRLSLVFFFLATGLYGVQWILKIIPAITAIPVTGDVPQVHLVLSGILITSMAYFYMKLSGFILSDPAYRQKSNAVIRLISKVMIPALFCLSGFLVLSFAILLISPDYLLSMVEAAVYTYAFLWIYHARTPSKSGFTLKTRVVLSLMAILLYPVLVNPDVTRSCAAMLEGDSTAIVPFAIHFLCLGLMVMLLLQANQYLAFLYHKVKRTRHYRRLMVYVLATFILLSEYDHWSMLLQGGGIEPAAEILRSNKFVPYSIMLLAISVVMLVHSFLIKSRFLRRISLVMIFLVLLKVFSLDIHGLSANMITILLISLGLVMVGVAWMIQMLVKKPRRDA